MGQEFLLDTNAVIDFCGGKLPATAMLRMQQIVNNVFYISPVVRIEGLGFNGPVADMQRLEGFLSFGNMLYITDEVIIETVRLRKQQKIKLRRCHHRCYRFGIYPYHPYPQYERL